MKTKKKVFIGIAVTLYVYECWSNAVLYRRHQKDLERIENLKDACRRRAQLANYYADKLNGLDYRATPFDKIVMDELTNE